MDATEAAQARQEAIDTLADLIDDIEVAMMTTADPKTGELRSRPMVTQNDRFDGTLWFFTGRASPKVDEVQHERHVNLSYAQPSDTRYVSVSGRAALVDDDAKKEQLWHEGLRAWFPDGLDDPDLGLLKVEVDQAEYWDPTSSALVRIKGFVKAVATGDSYEPDANEKLQM